MAEEKKNELIFSLHDNMTNELICSGNASIYIIKDGKKIVIANKKLTIFPTKVEIEEKYLREKLYIELLDNPAYKPSPFPDPNIATIPICFCRQSLIQSVRFIPKGTYIGIVKAYGSEMGILNSKEEVYLSNWKDETISIAKDQTITLKAFLFYNVEKGKKKSSNRFFLNNDDIENREYQTNKGLFIGKDTGRESYLDIIKKSKISVYSTPGVDKAKNVAGRFNQVTPRVLELISGGCYVLGHYPDNPDTEYYDLKSIVPQINSYSDFEFYMNLYRSKPSRDIVECRNYINKHNTSSRVVLLKDILKKHGIMLG